MISDKKIAKHIETFKTFCKNNRLRLKEDDDGLPVARAIGKFSNDQFFCNFQDGTIGVYVFDNSGHCVEFIYYSDEVKKKLGL